MRIEISTITIKCSDAPKVARFWLQLLSYEVAPNHTASILCVDPQGAGPALLFQPTSVPPSSDRIHLDLRPENHDEAVAQALDLGATETADWPATTDMWTVLSDPEGNHFCILQSRQAFDDLISETPSSTSPI